MALKARIENGVVFSPYPSLPVPEMSLYQVVKHCLEQHGNRTAVVWEDEQITFSELLKMFQRYAAGFQRHGVDKGEKVLVHLDNSLENMIAMYSIVFAGGVAVASETILSDDDILYMIRNSNATHILTTSSEASRFSGMRERLEIKGCFTTGTAPGFVSVAEFKKLKEDSYEELPAEDAKNEVAVHLYTSGTTGRPKAVEHTQYSLVASLPRPGYPQTCDCQEVFASWIPITAVAGFTFFLTKCSYGAETVLLSKSTGTEEILDSLRKYKVTCVAGSGPRMVLLAKAMEKKGIRLESLKNIVICSVSVTHKLLRQLEPSFDVAVIKNSYGTTEAIGICRPPYGASKWYGIGFPYPMVEIKVVDVQNGQVLGPNEKGEALVKSPSSMRGYYGNPEATSQTITPDGWIRTGDICYYNEDGQFFYVERMSQFFRCMGIQVAPSSIESVLLNHEGIAEAAVIGVPHPQYEEVAMAFVVLTESCGKITEAMLQNFVAGQLGKYMHLHGGVKFVHRLPRDTNGKVIRKKLQMLHVDD
ncbi:4-coumarate--CoA ligase 1 [Ixodes scapularis]